MELSYLSKISHVLLAVLAIIQSLCLDASFEICQQNISLSKQSQIPRDITGKQEPALPSNTPHQRKTRRRNPTPSLSYNQEVAPDNQNLTGQSGTRSSSAIGFIHNRRNLISRRVGLYVLQRVVELVVMPDLEQDLS
jgi:hypothetical protein